MLRPNGEIYGVPLVAGVFEFTVLMTNSAPRFPGTRRAFVPEVFDNTDDNVYIATDIGYEFTRRLPEIITVAADHIIVSRGAHHEFIDLWLNGVRLVRGFDFDHEEGSTVITLRAQTFGTWAVPGRNTLAAEFRIGGSLDNELRRAAQNFTLQLGAPSPPPVIEPVIIEPAVVPLAVVEPPPREFIGAPAVAAAVIEPIPRFGPVPQTGVRDITGHFIAMCLSFMGMVVSAVYIVQRRRRKRTEQ